MNNIAKYRKARKMSQSQLASLVGAAQNTVSNWENGNREPNNHTLIKLSEILDVPIEALLETYDMNRVKELRMKNGYSQQQLADALNVHQTAISQWETGRTSPNIDIAISMAHLFNVSLEYLLGKDEAPRNSRKDVKIPGIVPVVIPIEAVEEITEDMARSGEYIGLKIKGDSMMPNICDGDVVIIRLQTDVESGETAIVMINGDDATCKKVVKHLGGITLVPNNPAYEPRYFTTDEINSTPVRVIGMVVELRRKF